METLTTDVNMSKLRLVASEGFRIELVIVVPSANQWSHDIRSPECLAKKMHLKISAKMVEFKHFGVSCV